MPRAGKSAQKLVIPRAPSRSGAAGARRVEKRLGKRDRESAQATGVITRQIKALAADYQREFSKLLSPSGSRALNAMRNSRVKLTRSQKIRRSLALLKEHGVERSQIHDLRRPYLRKTRDLVRQATEAFPNTEPVDGLCDSPWVAHTAPFAGYSWWYKWNRTSGPKNPVLERYLEPATGRIGSLIETKDPDAGDNDELTADYYTVFQVWHTPQKTGPLELSRVRVQRLDLLRQDQR